MAHCMTAPVTAISGRSWKGRMPRVAPCLPRRTPGSPLPHPETQPARERLMKTIALIAAAALTLPMASMAQTNTTGSSTKPAANTTGKKVVQKVVPKRVIKKLEENKPIAEETDVTLSEQDLK